MDQEQTDHLEPAQHPKKTRFQRAKDNIVLLRHKKNWKWKHLKKPIFYTVLTGIAIAILIPLLTYLYFIRDLGSKEKILARKSEGIVLTDRNDEPFFTFYQARTSTTVPISEISQFAQDAVVAIEDKGFYEHEGFSPRALARAFLANVQEERIAQGGSTITQQLVKNTLLTQNQTILRKYQEIFLALEIDRRYEKKDILEMYMNTSYFGEGAYGIQDAAQAYFNKDASDLTLAESSMLAGILPAPSAFSPISGDEDRAKRRQELVLSEMVDQGLITQAQMDQALSQTLRYGTPTSDLNKTAPHFALMVKDALIDEYGEQRIARSGYRIKTTIDLELQEYTQNALTQQVNRLARNRVTNGAVVVLNPRNGEVLALVGSHDWSDEENGKINMAIAARQPGSSFKPIIYAKAFEERVVTPATELEDKQLVFPGGYRPRNYDNRFRGKVLVRYSLANSLNIPSLLIMDRVGVKNGVSFAKGLGITTLSNDKDYGLPLVLGSGEVPLTEMTSAYGAFAAEGELYQRIYITEVRDKNGKVVDRFESDSDRRVDRGVAYQISSILSDNEARQDTFGGALTISRQAAVKTGTTEDYRDALTIGYTPSLVVGVWIGNNDRTPMDSIAGSLGAAPVWRQVMERALRGTRVERFSAPVSLDRVLVCKENGLKAAYATSSAYMEFFLRGTSPKQDCDLPSPTGSVTPTETPKPTDRPQDTPTNTPQPTSAPTSAPTNAPTPTTGVLPTLFSSPTPTP